MTDKNRSEVPADLIGEGETYTKHVQPTEAPEDLISVDEDYVASQIDPRNAMLYTGLVNALGQPVVHAGIKKLAEKTGNAPKTYDDALVRYAKAMFGENALVKKDQSAIQRANQRALGNPELREGSARLKPIRLGGGVAETSVRPTNFIQKLAQETIDPSKAKGLSPGVLRTFGRVGTGAVGGYNIVDAYNRALAGDVPGAVVSGIGGAGHIMSYLPNKKISTVGKALNLIAPAANYYTGKKKEEDEFAHGGVVGYAGGTKVVKSGLKALGDMILPPAENAARTQIIGTLPTYEKAAGILKREGASGPAIDFGAGLGEGAKFLGKDAHTFEPFAQNWTPTYSKASQIPSDLYGQLTNLNVLNVVPREARDEIVQDIGRVMRPGGLGIITTRGKDVMNAKGLAGPEANSIITSRDTYQKGFTKDELEQYLKYMLGDAFDINRLNLGPAGVLLRKK